MKAQRLMAASLLVSGGLLLVGSLLVVGSVPAGARDCRPADAPPGVRAPLRPGCEPAKTREIRQPDRDSVRAGRDPGFVDLGNGTTVRIGGRVRVDTVFHR